MSKNLPEIQNPSPAKSRKPRQPEASESPRESLPQSEPESPQAASPESPAAEPSAPSTGSEEVAALAAEAAAEEGEGVEEEAAGPPETPDGCIDREAFRSLFVGAHTTVGHVVDLRTLVAVGDNPAALAAADAIYDTACEVEALRFLIEPGGKWVQRAASVLVFAVPVALGCGQEIKAKRQAKAERKAAKEAASRAAREGTAEEAPAAKPMENRVEAVEVGA